MSTIFIIKDFTSSNMINAYTYRNLLFNILLSTRVYWALLFKEPELPINSLHIFRQRTESYKFNMEGLARVSYSDKFQLLNYKFTKMVSHAHRFVYRNQLIWLAVYLMVVKFDIYLFIAVGSLIIIITYFIITKLIIILLIFFLIFGMKTKLINKFLGIFFIIIIIIYLLYSLLYLFYNLLF